MDPILNINKSVYNNYNRYGKLIGVNNKGKTYERIYQNGRVRVLACVSPFGELLKTVTKVLYEDYSKIFAKDYKTGNEYFLVRNSKKATDASRIVITNKNDDFEEKVKLKKDDEGTVHIDYVKKEKKLGKKLNLYEVWADDAYSFFGINSKQKGHMKDRSQVYEIADDVYLPRQSTIILNNQHNVLYGAPLVSYTSNIDKYLAENIVATFHNKFTAFFGMHPINKNK